MNLDIALLSNSHLWTMIVGFIYRGTLRIESNYFLEKKLSVRLPSLSPKLKPDVSLEKLGHSDGPSLHPKPPHQCHFDESLTKTHGNMQYWARTLSTADRIPSYVCLQYMPYRADSLLSCSIEK